MIPLALAKNSWLYEALKECLPGGIFLTDSQFVILDHNQESRRLLGIEGPLYGRSLTELLPWDLFRKQGYLVALRAGRSLENLEFSYRDLEGRNLTLVANIFSYAPEGQVLGFVFQLFEARRLRRHERERRQFMSMLAHDFKAPLVIVMGLVRRLLEEKAGPLSEKQKRYLQTVNRELSKLEDLVFSFLEMLKLETGQITLHPVAFDLGDLVREVAMKMGPLAAKKGLRLQIEIKGPVPLVADRLQMERVITNLLDNAIKYSHEGGAILLKAWLGRDRAFFEISDQGVGIPPEEIPHIFEPFHRLREKEGAVPTGSGLGLSIVKGIVEAHGGEIDVFSTPGQGTTFVVSLPRGGACPV